jgi:hypothetical protein
MSLLDTKKYPLELDFNKYLVFQNIQEGDIHPIFKMRLAAFARDIIKGKMNFLEGSRTYERQVYFYVNSGGKQNSKGIWYGGNGMAAKPGTSKHEFDVAVDSADIKVKNIDSTAPTMKQITLLQYGLYKPMTRGNCTSVIEDWHIEPIETFGPIDKLKFKEDSIIWKDKMFIQDKCEFSNMFDVFNLMDTHKYAKSMFCIWKNSYLNQNKLPHNDISNHSKCKELIQAKCKFSNPNGVWTIMDKHKYATALYAVWARSYLK